MEVISGKIFTFLELEDNPSPPLQEKYWQAVSFQELLTKTESSQLYLLLERELTQKIFEAVESSFFGVLGAVNIC